MILRHALKPDEFVRLVSRVVTTDSMGAFSPSLSIARHEEKLVYLGAGYWRAQLIWMPDEEARLVGLHLVNPDYQPYQIQLIERAVALILHVHYRPTL